MFEANEVETIKKNINSEDEKIQLKSIGKISTEAFNKNLEVVSMLPQFEKLFSECNNQTVICKALWAMGQIGYSYPESIIPFIDVIQGCFSSENPNIRCNAVWAIGRIGRSNTNLILLLIPELLQMRLDVEAKVRMNFIWSCENIATNSPEIFKDKIGIFEELLFDSNVEIVRREAPEIFRVLGKKKSHYVKKSIPLLEKLLEDDDRVVRIHANGALRAINNGLQKQSNH